MSSAFEGFVAVHKYQLSAIPEELWQPLFMKLGEDYLDAGSVVELHYGDPLDGYSLHVKADASLERHGNIYLIDHAWTTTPETAKKQLHENPGLLERLENLMDIEAEEMPPEEKDPENEIQHDEDTIRMVADQAGVSYEKAKEALEAEKYEVVNAIMHLTMDEEVKKEADRLQEQVMGQLIASGKAQEKEEKVNKEKEERRKKQIADWMQRRIDYVYQAMWAYIQTYSFSVLKENGQPDTQTAWYINDEVGSALTHSSDPNMACMPFIFSRGASGMIPYSVLFPVKDIAPGAIVTCDLVPRDLGSPMDKIAYLFAFKDRLLPDDDIEEKQKMLIDAYRLVNTELKAQSTQQLSDPRIVTASEAVDVLKASKKPRETPLRVYTTTEFVRQYLKLPNVKFTDDMTSADIIWSSQDFSAWDQLKPGQTINQYPNESCLTFKHNYANLVRQVYGTPSWMMTTYNLVTQLGEFVGDYLASEEEDPENNIWIVKPWNYARGLEISISRSLSEIIRQHDNAVPKIAQRYLTTPCLYNGKKFDLRYIVLVRHIQPTMVACVYNMFWIRLANKKFDLEDLSDYERQFTVMNYSNFQMTQLDYKSFIFNMEKQHKIQWDGVQRDINQAMKGTVCT
ncbi:tubulin-tyrosine ligase family-domain-containing protein [Radiomyces spectabilis]|uniref:tubulin-tyrosine ligase family-domain-containing protein n=1 Tax=Radiomyces spectabilis TaxID=64574 RepID=UPI00221F8E90|nr:tubulin-tyrosine ligase family-domain-containing protein [Radiomyces spectabilis]KAI8381422.1 tubulin-tyrosine ligase family-domain-containing protein [Radiomyces spectabilis]